MFAPSEFAVEGSGCVSIKIPICSDTDSPFPIVSIMDGIPPELLCPDWVVAGMSNIHYDRTPVSCIKEFSGNLQQYPGIQNITFCRQQYVIVS
jgi:hypothetical protein